MVLSLAKISSRLFSPSGAVYWTTGVDLLFSFLRIMIESARAMMPVITGTTKTSLAIVVLTGSSLK